MIKAMIKNDLPACLEVKAKEPKLAKIQLGMIDDDKRLRKWYERNGFINVI